MNEKRNGQEPQAPEESQLGEFDDDATDELPVLEVEGTEGVATSGHPAYRKAGGPSEDGRAASWISGMEAEIKELQDRWKSLDSELRRAEELTEKFRAESEEKDNIIESLNDEVAEHIKQIELLNRQVAELDGSVARFEAARDLQDAKLDKLSDELRTAQSNAAVLEDRLRAAQQDRDELSRSIGEEKSRLVEMSAKRDTVTETNQRLATRVQDLENYIEGRKDKWSALNFELESGKQRISELEQNLAASEQGLQARRDEIESLEQRIIELERLRSEAEGRHKEREQAYRETQSRLTEQAAEIERLRVAADNEDIARWQARVTELEAKVAEKNEIIQAFNRNVERLTVLKQNLHPHREGQKPGRSGAEAQGSKRLFVPLGADGSEQAEISLSKPVVTIGRAKDSDICILDAVVSRAHARLTTDEDGTVIEDLGSKNGISVNSQPVNRAVLHHGDVISIGEKNAFRFVDLDHATH